MAHVLTQNAEANQRDKKTKQVESTTPFVVPASFNYYIHDSVTTLSFKLIGDMRSRNVTELNGSWETARPTLAQRCLVLDLCLLRSTDEQSRQWLLSMKDLGATFVPALDTGKNTSSMAAHAGGGDSLSLLSRILGTLKPKP